ncbi:MAG: L,D-transpeptidase family protein [Deferrisomatales bacterium]
MEAGRKRTRGLARSLPALGLAALAVASLAGAQGRGAVYPGEDPLIGDLPAYTVGAEDSLMEVARRFDVGYEEIARANPGVDPFAPPVGEKLLIPTRWIVPSAARRADGILVNLSEFRLYYAYRFQGQRLLATFPVGIGTEGRRTPLGRWQVVEKLTAPAWYVPPSIRRERPELPWVVPPGPGNPLGTHALRLSAPGILIHGTHRPWSVGREVSAGCIRLYPEDIVRLFRMVPVGTPVEIVREPVKVAAWGGRVYVEVDPDPAVADPPLATALRALEAARLLGRVDRSALAGACREGRGVPVDVTASPVAGQAQEGAAAHRGLRPLLLPSGAAATSSAGVRRP